MVRVDDVLFKIDLLSGKNVGPWVFAFELARSETK